jgi:hypothetical protein
MALFLGVPQECFLGVLCVPALKIFDFNSEPNSELEAI